MRSKRMVMAVLIVLAGYGCGKEKPFSNPRLYATPPPPAQAPPLASPATTIGGWTVTLSERVVPNNPGLRENVWTLSRPPHGQYDYIALHRIAPERMKNGVSQPVFLFLPGPHWHGEVIVPDEQYDLRLYLANRSVETWTLDYRTHFVPRDQIFDSLFMRTWTTQTFIEDAAAAADFVRQISGSQKIFVGGYSRGATFAALLAARYGRGDILGLVLLDGYVLSPPGMPPLYRERPATPNWFADDLESRYVPYRRWIKMLKDTLADPDGPDFMPIHVFHNRTEMLAHFLYVSRSPLYGQHGGLSNAQGGYADVLTLARFFLHQDRYWPRVQNHGGFDLKRHLSDVAFDYEQAFMQLNVPILAFANGNIDKGGQFWAARVEYTARATASTDIRYIFLQDWGHLDLMFGTGARETVFQPLLEWVKQHYPAFCV